MELENFGSPADKAVRRAFSFPGDADDGIYGIDVSHHNGAVDWKTAADAGSKFVYIKASQGSSFRDPRFQQNWAAAKAAGMTRGAYHFLSAGISGTDQAKTYLAIVNASGGIQAGDLTPVLDIEWDVDRATKKDRWEKYTAAQIAQFALDWATEVEKQTGRKPLIYTANSWWEGRMGNSVALKAYKHWIADYRESSHKRGAPVSVRGHAYVAWQFTDIGKLPKTDQRFDVNFLPGTLDSLKGK